MSLSSSQLLFFSTLLLGTTLSISSSSWFGVWIGLELNLLSFIPIISVKNNQYSSEAALKYFLIQALGSSIIILSASFTLFSMNSSSILLTTALLLKAGAAPFHFWFPSVMEGLQWPQAILLMTIQKIAPMSLLSYLNFEIISPILFSTIILSALVGAIGGMNQTLLRKIMAYSSINHMAWMISAILISESSWLLYFLVYSFVSSSIALLFNLQEAFHISHILNHTNHSSPLKMLTFMSLLSLGGLPPFTGFIPKWFIIQEMISANLLFPLSVLLMSALLTLFYYLRIAMSAFLISSPKTKWAKSTTLPSFFTPMMIYLNSLGLLAPSFFMLLI
uniref:NADH-ubiquinone oxidoreductase chain 2 n=1 Tax=Gordonella aff. paravillosa ZS-2018 TaxID=2291892 RepID=A0A345WJD7_9EUCA|nr:NADH dehydrogenase subunit 2 [Gordonella aff. paravillosa ZS-2018]AXJ93180.1 NADH dehydrogenase subunit 2 [Gordonella aff. paravillosa ZS-2018]